MYKLKPPHTYPFIYSSFESLERTEDYAIVQAGEFRNEELDASSRENDVARQNLLCLRLNYYATNYDRDGHDARKIFRLSNQDFVSLAPSSSVEIQNYVIRYEVRNNEDNSDPGTANKSLQTEGTRAYQAQFIEHLFSKFYRWKERDKSKSADVVSDV